MTTTLMTLRDEIEGEVGMRTEMGVMAPGQEAEK